MNLGSLAQNIGLSTGNVVMEDASLQQQYAQTEAVKSETAMRKMTMMMQQTELQNNQRMGQEFAAAMKTQGEGISTQQQVAQAAAKVAAQEGSQGNLIGMQKMETLAREAEETVKADQLQQAQQLQMKRETTAKAAAEYQTVLGTNQSDPEARTQAASNLRRAAIAAGADPKTIPLSDSPAFASWAQQRTMDGMSSKEAVKFKQAQQKVEEDRKLREEQFKNTERHQLTQERQAALNHEDAMKDRNESRALRMQLAAAAEADRKERLRMEQERLDFLKGKAGGPKTGVLEQRTSDTVIRNAAQAVRVIDNLLAEPSSATAGIFSKLKDGTAIEALTKAGGNILTPQTSQEVGAIGAEAGLILGQIVTAGSGGRASLPIIQSFQSMATPQPGDTDAMKLMRVANMAEMVKLELTNIVPGATPQLESNRQEYIKTLDSLPSVKEVIKAFPAKERAEAMRVVADQTKKRAELTGQATAITPPTPAEESHKALPPGVVSAADYFK